MFVSSSEPLEEQSETIHSEEKIDCSSAPSTNRTANCLSLVRWKTLFLLLCTVLAMLIVWISTSNLFDVPRDVRKDRQLYSIARRQYIDNPHYWYTQWQQFDLLLKKAIKQNREQEIPSILQQITPQVLIAFLVNQTNCKIEQLKTTAIIPKISGSSFIIAVSKPEPNIWPFKVMLSIEIKTSLDPEAPSLTVSRLRRGSQELHPGLSWAYFGPEFERLKTISSISTPTRIDQLEDRIIRHQIGEQDPLYLGETQQN